MHADAAGPHGRHGEAEHGVELAAHGGPPGSPGAHAALAMPDDSERGGGGYESDATAFSEGTVSDAEDGGGSPAEGRALLSAVAPMGALPLLFSESSVMSSARGKTACP
jgi:hypothetical protein